MYASDVRDATADVRSHKNRNKRVEAEERMTYRKELSDAEQLKRLDKRLGTGIGARNERARLSKRITPTTVDGVSSTNR